MWSCRPVPHYAAACHDPQGSSSVGCELSLNLCCFAVQLPGADAGKPDVAGAVKDAVKKSPVGAMQVGDLALSFPGQANDKEAFTAPKPGEAKGLPAGPTAKPPSGPSLPKVGLS